VPTQFMGHDLKQFKSLEVTAGNFMSEAIILSTGNGYILMSSLI
jgi:hypothetical protein